MVEYRVTCKMVDLADEAGVMVLDWSVPLALTDDRGRKYSFLIEAANQTNRQAILDIVRKLGREALVIKDHGRYYYYIYVLEILPEGAVRIE